jgi:hypothetical protein
VTTRPELAVSLVLAPDYDHVEISLDGTTMGTAGQMGRPGGVGDDAPPALIALAYVASDATPLAVARFRAGTQRGKALYDARTRLKISVRGNPGGPGGSGFPGKATGFREDQTGGRGALGGRGGMGGSVSILYDREHPELRDSVEIDNSGGLGGPGGPGGKGVRGLGELHSAPAGPVGRCGETGDPGPAPEFRAVSLDEIVEESAR